MNGGDEPPPDYEELAWLAKREGALGSEQSGQGSGLLGFIKGKYQLGKAGDAETVRVLEYAYQAGGMEEKGGKA